MNKSEPSYSSVGHAENVEPVESSEAETNALKFGALLAADPAGAVLVLSSALLEYALSEDDKSQDSLGDYKTELVKAREEISKQKVTNNRFDVWELCRSGLCSSEGIIKPIYDATVTAVEGLSDPTSKSQETATVVKHERGEGGGAWDSR